MLEHATRAFLIAAGCTAGLWAQPAALRLAPMPAKVVRGEGKLSIGQSFPVDLARCPDQRVAGAAKRLVTRLARQTGMPMNPGGIPARGPALAVVCGAARSPVPTLDDDESYTLQVSPAGARLEAPEPAGILHGMETFLQLVEPDGEGFAAPAVGIEDRPRFRWRGLLVDMAHHFMPMEAVRRNVDAMAALKMNVMHLHLASDYGFRLESKVYPRLHGMGSDGDFYSQDEIRALVTYAAERGVRILPGLEVPGHIRSWFVGYPELATVPGPYQLKRFWGLMPDDPVLDVTREEAYVFLDHLLGEVAGLFPDEYMHIGGDEVRADKWTGNPRVQAFMRERGFSTAADLQAWFNSRLDPIVRRHGKKMVGWDEVLHPGLPKTTVVHVWRARKTLAEAVRQGYPAILSYGYYLDHMRPAAFHYAVDPLGEDFSSLSDRERSLVLGGHACMWSEHVSPETLDGRIWPRTAAIAERLWSPAEVKDPASMYRRVEAVSRKLDWLDLTHRSGPARMMERLADGRPLEPLQVMAEALEPLGLGPRARAHQQFQQSRYFQHTPLNRLVDALPPESTAAREFGEAVDRGAWSEVRARLARWRDNQVRVLPVLRESPLLGEAVPVAENLAEVVAAGLQAVDAIEARRPAAAAWSSEQLAVLDRAAKATRAEVNIAIAPHVRRLVEKAAGRR